MTKSLWTKVPNQLGTKSYVIISSNGCFWLSFILACYGSLVASQLRLVFNAKTHLRVHLHSASIGSLACNELTLGWSQWLLPSRGKCANRVVTASAFRLEVLPCCQQCHWSTKRIWAVGTSLGTKARAIQDSHCSWDGWSIHRHSRKDRKRS